MSVTDRAPNPALFAAEAERDRRQLLTGRPRPVNFDDPVDLPIDASRNSRRPKIDMTRLAEATQESRLDKLKVMAQSLTYGEMMELAKSIVPADGYKPPATSAEWAAQFHAWVAGTSDVNGTN